MISCCSRPRRVERERCRDLADIALVVSQTPTLLFHDFTHPMSAVTPPWIRPAYTIVQKMKTWARMVRRRNEESQSASGSSKTGSTRHDGVSRSVCLSPPSSVPFIRVSALGCFAFANDNDLMIQRHNSLRNSRCRCLQSYRQSW